MIEIRKMTSEFDGMRDLWCKTFGDRPEGVYAMFNAWKSNIESYILVDDNGLHGKECYRKVVAALTLYKMGDLVNPEDGSEKPCYVSYAICTDEKCRGLGYGSMLTEYAKDIVLRRGGVSMLCPANRKLIGFYLPMGYEPRFYASEGSVDVEAVDFDSRKYTVDAISVEEYGVLREQLLSDTVHVKLNSHTLEYLDVTSKGFFKINNGEAIAVVDRIGKQKLNLSEMLSATLPIQTKEAVAALGIHYGKRFVEYSTKGDDYLQGAHIGGEYVQAMIASREVCNFSRGYFGFPFD